VTFDKTKFHFLKEDCIIQFGTEKGNTIYNHSNNLFEDLLKENDYVENHKIRKHLVTHLFPIIAYYLTLREFNFSKKESYKFSYKEIEKLGNIKKKRNEKLVKIPFIYYIIKVIAKIYINNKWPVEAWKTEWLKRNKYEIHFRFHGCVYFNLTKKYGCPEICKLFCAEDNISSSGYAPKMIFEREKTIGRGDKYCDFHLKNGKNNNRNNNK